MQNITLTPKQEKKFLNEVFFAAITADEEARKKGDKVFEEGIAQAESLGHNISHKSMDELYHSIQSIHEEELKESSIVQYFENMLLGVQSNTTDPMQAIMASQQYNKFQELKQKFIESEKLNNIQDF
jgi:poly(A) polymerase Pap1